MPLYGQRPNDDVALEVGHLFLEVIALRRQGEQLVGALQDAQAELQRLAPDVPETVEDTGDNAGA